MAKRNKDEAQTENQTAETAPTSGPASRQITVQGLIFDVPDIYSEGHPLTALEANALNQMRSENLRNNFANAVKKAREAFDKENPELKEQPLTDDIVEGLKRQFAEYAEKYQFSVRTAASPVDPVEREAHKIAKSMLDEKLKAKGVKKADLAEGKYDELVAALLEKSPGIREEAKRRVAMVKEAATGGIEDLLSDVTAPAAEAAE